jgi:polyhydroxybutyrate depolymerase
MRTFADRLAALAVLALFACEEQPAQRDGSSATLVSDAAALGEPDGQVASDAATPTSDITTTNEAGLESMPSDASAPSAASDAAVSTLADVVVAPPAQDAASDAAQPAVDAGPKTCSAGSPLRAGSQSIEIMVAGQPRSFKLFVPRAYTGTMALPLIVDFHGLLLGQLFYEVFTEWDEQLEREGYLLAMPQGIDDAWNVGPCCTQSRAVDDVAFARAIVEHVRSLGCIDAQRVYATGYSNGGGMSLKLACDAADVFAAVAPAAFDLLEEMDCKPARPLSVFIFRGTNDDIVPYAGGASTPPTPYTLPEIHFLGAQKTFERWAQLNGCTGAPSDSAPYCKTYSECRAGVKVTLCTAQGGGHDPIVVDRAWPMLKAFSKP